MLHVDRPASLIPRENKLLDDLIDAIYTAPIALIRKFKNENLTYDHGWDMDEVPDRPKDLREAVEDYCYYMLDVASSNREEDDFGMNVFEEMILCLRVLRGEHPAERYP